MKIIVIGPSDWDDARKMGKVLSKMTKPGDVLLLKGRLKGTARMAHDWATSGPKENWREVLVFYLDGEKDKAEAESRRERDMLKEADGLICFGPPGRMVAKAKERGIKIKVLKEN